MMRSQHRRLKPNGSRLDELGKERAHPIAAADLMADTMAGCIGACWRHWSISSMDRPASWSSFIILSYNNVHPIHMWSWRIHFQEEEDDKNNNNNNNKTHTHREEARGEAQKKNKPWAESKGECGAESSWEQKRPASPPPMYHCCSLAKSSRSPAQSSDAAAAMPSLSLSLSLSNRWRSSLNPKHKRVWLQLQKLEKEGGEMNSSAATEEEEEEEEEDPPPKF